MVYQKKISKKLLQGRIKYVGFDKDGTLIDDFDGYSLEWGRLINEQFGIDSKEATEVFIKMAGIPTAIQLAAVFQKHNRIFSQTYIFQKAEEIAYSLGKNVKGNLFPEVRRVLRELKKNNFFIFVSSGQREIITKEDLERTGIIQYVDFFAGIKPNEPEFKKGEPHFREAANYFGVPFEAFTKEAVFVGDTLVDIDIANKLDILSIARIGTLSREKLLKTGAKYVVEDFSNLDQIISEL